MTSTLLYAPTGYWALSEEAKKEICDGCGPNFLGDFIPDSLLGLDITDACDIHDYMYTIGSSENDRETADRIFRNNMLRIVNHDSSRWLKPIRRLMARVYYNIVRDFGGPCFWEGKNAQGTMRSPAAFMP